MSGPDACCGQGLSTFVPVLHLHVDRIRNHVRQHPTHHCMYSEKSIRELVRSRLMVIEKWKVSGYPAVVVCRMEKVDVRSPKLHRNFFAFEMALHSVTISP